MEHKLKTGRLREFFEITKIAKKFDRASNTFNISIAYRTATCITPRTLAVAEAFGLGVDKSQTQILYDNIRLHIGSQDIVYITGESGSGKSILLKRLEQLLAPNTFNIRDIQVDHKKPLVDTVGRTVEEGLELLSRVGLNDAFLFIRKYSQLSDGQRYRYRIAKLIEADRQYWVMDEFCSTLDRDTAKIVAYNVQKLARQEGKAVLAATTHTDLFEDLKPSVHIHKRFGKEVKVQYYPNKLNKECSLTKQMHIRVGTIEDYRQLAQFHYRDTGGMPPPRKIFIVKRQKELVGVIVYSYPPIICFGRNKAIKERLTTQELNKKLSIISRVVLHPKYRTIGLGAKLVKETLPLANTPYVEAVAVMARYNPFFEKAEMQKIAEQTPSQSCVEALEKLHMLGFNPVLLASTKQNMRQLKTMNKQALEKCRDILANVQSLRLRRSIVPEPFVSAEAYKSALRKAKIEKIAQALRVLSILMQTKVYLLWKNPDKKEA